MKNFRTVPNQKVIMNNVKITGRYYQVDEATFTAGCRDLKPTTFLVWQALNLQYFTDKELALSTQQISELMGNLRIPTIREAIAELIEKGWMINVAGNVYALVSPVARKACDVLPNFVSKNAVERKASDDVERKACDASNEKRATGSTETVREIRIKEEYNKNNNNNNRLDESTNIDYVDEDNFNEDYVKRTNMDFDDSELPF